MWGSEDFKLLLMPGSKLLRFYGFKGIYLDHVIFATFSRFA